MSGKTCFCHTCNRSFSPHGIARHRAAHRDKFEDCVITYTNGDRHKHPFAERAKREGDTDE